MNTIQTIFLISTLFLGLSNEKSKGSYTSRDEPTLPGIEIFNFQTNEAYWYTVNDDVMGGISSSSVEIINPGYLSFSGSMSLENNGGFASARSDWAPIDLAEYDGILLRVFGDGNIYRLRIRTAEAGREISYNALFEAPSDKWNLIYIPFEIMIPTYRGFVMDVGPLDESSIGSFGLMLSDKQDGDFSLAVDWIRAVNEDELYN